ncbi:4Fe-4S binding protein, partial [uncultured Desulfovibrio sp.]|uniref:ATP-binding protein n=1 Tax=uncultured Desulfovibrio sp. TaxID=167968 RepID=UPI00263386CF
MQRPIIEIDEEKCDGCGQCVLDCAEGALAVIDGKARLISEVYCDGLGACLNCPQGALRIVTREAPAFDEAAALAAKAAREGRPAGAPGGHGCPGS